MIPCVREIRIHKVFGKPSALKGSFPAVVKGRIGCRDGLKEKAGSRMIPLPADSQLTHLFEGVNEIGKVIVGLAKKDQAEIEGLTLEV
jgi:hypothetical protein